ncbi:MAG: hypothetical protein R3C49_11890 [Planctomycetaceae bacterium]
MISGPEGAAAERWNRVFQKPLNPRVMETVFTFLHSEQRYDDAIEGLQAAIRNNHAQPWMYDVLAIEMKLAGRPQAEISRVLESRIDFAAGNDDQVLPTATMLAGFDAFDEAIALCRQAAERHPWDSRIWSTAREIAKRSQNANAIIWAQAGTIRHVWSKDYPSLHAESELVLTDLATELKSAGRTQSAAAAVEELRKAKARDLRIRIHWTGDADLDLSVGEPNGQTCSRKNPVTSNGGLLIAQSNGGKSASRSGPQTEEYVCVEAPAGQFTATVRYFTGTVTLGRVIVEVLRNENTPEFAQATQTLQGVVDRDVSVTIEVEPPPTSKSSGK